MRGFGAMVGDSADVSDLHYDDVIYSDFDKVMTDNTIEVEAA